MLPNKTVVARFKNMDDVGRVAAALQNAGVSKNSIKSMDKHDLEAIEKNIKGDDQGILSLLKRMFGKEHRMDSTHTSSLYADWTRNGGVLLAVETEGGRADEVEKIMGGYADTEMSGRMTAAAPSEKASITDEPKKTLRATSEIKNRALRSTEGETIPVFQEELHVGKRKVERGPVRVFKHVVEEPIEETVRLRDEKITVERHLVNRIASEADLRAFADSRVEMMETAEEPVVSKEIHVTEEITITKSIVDHDEKIRDKVRKTEVEIEGLGSEKLREIGFKKDFESRFAKLGRNYSDYGPAYEMGNLFATDDRYRNRDWSSIESDIRSRWEARETGAWKEFKDAIRHGWETVRGRDAA